MSTPEHPGQMPCIAKKKEVSAFSDLPRTLFDTFKASIVALGVLSSSGVIYARPALADLNVPPVRSSRRESVESIQEGLATPPPILKRSVQMSPRVTEPESMFYDEYGITIAHKIPADLSNRYIEEAPTDPMLVEATFMEVKKQLLKYPRNVGNQSRNSTVLIVQRLAKVGDYTDGVGNKKRLREDENEGFARSNIIAIDIEGVMKVDSMFHHELFHCFDYMDELSEDGSVWGEIMTKMERKEMKKPDFWNSFIQNH